MPTVVLAEMVKRRLDVDEDQGLVVDHALADAKEAWDELAATWRELREEAAEVLRDEVVDDAAMESLFGRSDEALARARRHGWSAVKQVHAVLDDEQRAVLAELVAHGPRHGRW